MPLTDQERDRDCLERVRAGDTRAMAELYVEMTRREEKVYLSPFDVKLATHIRGDDARGLLCKLGVRQVWKRAASYDPRRGTVPAWLLTVARTRAIDRYRSAASRGRAESSAEPEPALGPEDPPGAAARAQFRERVRAALGRLMPEQRRVLEIAYFQGLSQSEIAESLGAPLGTVKSWTRQGLMKLRELMPREEWV